MQHIQRLALVTLVAAAGCVSGSIFKPWYGDRALEPQVRRSAASDTVEVTTAQPSYAALVFFAPDGSRSAIVTTVPATRHGFLQAAGEIDARAVHDASTRSIPRVSRGSSCGWVREAYGTDASGQTVYRNVPRCVEIPSPAEQRLTRTPAGPFMIAVTSETPIEQGTLVDAARHIDVYATPYQAASLLARDAFNNETRGWSLAVFR